MCAVMSGIALEQMGGFQLSYININLVPSYVSGPSPAVGLLVHMSWTRPHTLQHCQVLCEVDMQQ